MRVVLVSLVSIEIVWRVKTWLVTLGRRLLTRLE